MQPERRPLPCGDGTALHAGRSTYPGRVAPPPGNSAFPGGAAVWHGPCVLLGQEVTIMIPPAGIVPVTTLGAVLGPVALLAVVSAVVVLAVIVVSLVAEHRWLAEWSELGSQPGADVPPVPVPDYAGPWAA
jgi:hypothetical protein